jgi:glycosyltransferase involved in cell wall biosynthesis
MYPTDEEPSRGCFVHEQVQDLQALGVDVTVLAFDGRGRKRAYADAGLALARLLRRERFDLVHAHYGLTGAAALLQRRVPLVVTFHGSDTGNPNVAWQAYVSWVVARACTPVFVSELAARRMGRAGAAVIPAGVDTDVFVPTSRRASRRALGWREDGRYVLLPGRRNDPVKRADLFDAVLAECRRDVPDIEGVPLQGYSRADVVHVMNGVDVTLMTSDAEGSPVATKESLACCTPVVSVPVGDLPQLLDGVPGCSIAPREPRALADGVLRALAVEREPALRERAEQYARRALAERTASLYESVLAERR